MKTDEAIRQAARQIGGITAASKAMGRDQNYIAGMLSRGSVPKADTLARIASVCGYRLVLVGHGEELEIEP